MSSEERTIETGNHVHLGRSLRAAVAAVPLAAAAVLLLGGALPALTAGILLGGAALLGALLSRTVRVAAPWEQAVIFRLGERVATRGPGVFCVWPLLDQVHFVDLRRRALRLGKQQALTLDQVGVTLEATLFFEIGDPAQALVAAEDLRVAVAEVSQASLRAVTARLLCSTLKVHPEQVQDEVATEIHKRTASWGVRVDAVRLLEVTVTDPGRSFEAPTATRELARPVFADVPAVPPHVIADVDGLSRGDAEDVVVFPADLGRQLERLEAARRGGNKLPD